MTTAGIDLPGSVVPGAPRRTRPAGEASRGTSMSVPAADLPRTRCRSVQRSAPTGVDGGGRVDCSSRPERPGGPGLRSGRAVLGTLGGRARGGRDLLVRLPRCPGVVPAPPRRPGERGPADRGGGRRGGPRRVGAGLDRFHAHLPHLSRRAAGPGGEGSPRCSPQRKGHLLPEAIAHWSVCHKHRNLMACGRGNTHSRARPGSRVGARARRVPARRAVVGRPVTGRHCLRRQEFVLLSAGST